MRLQRLPEITLAPWTEPLPSDAPARLRLLGHREALRELGYQFRAAADTRRTALCLAEHKPDCGHYCFER
jgi:hypothetical protein